MRITKRSAYSALAGVGILMGAAGVTAAATGSDTSPAPAAVAQPADQATPADDESAEDPADEAGDEANERLESDGQDGDQNGDQDGDQNGDHDGQGNHDDDGPETPPAYTSSVQTTPEDESSEASEADEEAALAALATVTPDDASATALAAEPGTVDEVELSNEAGNVVYEVEIVTDAGVEMEVIIDAGNGEVLAVQAD